MAAARAGSVLKEGFRTRSTVDPLDAFEQSLFNASIASEINRDRALLTATAEGGMIAACAGVQAESSRTPSTGDSLHSAELPPSNVLTLPDTNSDSNVIRGDRKSVV